MTNHLLSLGGHLASLGGHLVSTGNADDCNCCEPAVYGCTLCDNYNTTPPTPPVGGKTAVITIAGITGSGTYGGCCTTVNQTYMIDPPWTRSYAGSAGGSCDPAEYIIHYTGGCGEPCSSELTVTIAYSHYYDQTTITIQCNGGTSDNTFAQVELLFVATLAGQVSCSDISEMNIPLSGATRTASCGTSGATCTLSLM